MRMLLLLSLASLASSEKIPSLIVKAEGQPYLEKREEKLLRCVLESDDGGRLRLERIQWWRDELELTDPELEGRVGEVEWVGNRLRLLPSRGSPSFEGSYQCSGKLRGLSPGDTDALPVIFSAPLFLAAARMDKFPSRYEQLELLDSEDVVTAYQGEVAFVPCPALPNSVPAPPYVWFERRMMDESQRKTFLEIETDRKRFLVTHAGLQIAVVQPEDAGRYRCLARNTVTGMVRRSKLWLTLRVLTSDTRSDGPERLGVRPDEARLVFPPPGQLEREVEAREGESLFLECVSGLGGQARWGRRAVGQEKWEDVELGKDRSQLWANLEIVSVTKEDAGEYRCTVLPPVSKDSPADDSGWRAPSALYRLVVKSDPLANLTVSEVGGTYEAAEATRLQCSMPQDSTAIPRIMLNGKKVEQVLVAGRVQNGFTVEDFSVAVRGGVVTHQASIGHPRAAGVFQCLLDVPASSAGSSDSVFLEAVEGEEEAVATLSGGLRIRVGPSHATRNLGESVTLLCQVSPPSATVRWLKDGAALDTEASVRHRVFGSGTLSIDDLRPDDAGLYLCRAQDAGGRTEDAQPARLTLLQQSGEFGLESVVLSGPDAYDSYEDSEERDETDYEGVVDPDFWNLSYETSAPRATTESLLVEEEEEEGSGQTPMEAEATTTAPPQTTQAEPSTLAEASSPAPVSLPAPDVVVHNNGSATLRWIIPQSLRLARSPIKAVRVQQKLSPGSEDGDTRWETLDAVLRPDASRTLVDLGPRQEVRFRLGLLFEDGTSQLSGGTEAVRFVPRPRQTAPTQAPQIVSVRSVSPWELEVGWAFAQERERSPVTAFRLEYQVLHSAERPGEAVPVRVEGGERRSLRLITLQSATPYRLRLFALNPAGESPPSSFAQGYTLKANGEAVTSMGPVAESTTGPAGVHREAEVWLTLDATTLLILGGMLVALLLLACVLCCVCCTLRDRKEKELNRAAKGKFLDASQKIFRESFRAPPSQGASLYAVRESGLYDDEDAPCLPDPHAHQPLPAAYAPKAVPYPHTHPGHLGTTQAQSPPALNLYTNPMPGPALYGSLEGRMDESSEPEAAHALYQPSASLYGVDEDEVGSGGDRQGSTPECDLPPLPSHHSPSAFPPPPSSHFVVAGPSHGLLHSSAPPPSLLNSSLLTDGSSVELGRGSSRSSGASAQGPPRSSLQPQPSTLERHKGSTSPLIQQADWDTMWARGGVSPPTGSLGRARAHPSVRGAGGILSDLSDPASPQPSPSHLNTFGKAASPLPPPPPQPHSRPPQSHYQPPPCVTIHDSQRYA